MSSCQRPMPWTAEVGKAWWLLCQASPKVSSASHARLRDSSAGLVAAPAEDVAQRVDAVGDVVQDEHRTAPPHSRPVSPAASCRRAGSRARSAARADDRPEEERAVDEPDHRVGEQVGRVALLVPRWVWMNSQPTCAWNRPRSVPRSPPPWSTCGLCGSPSSSANAWCLRWSATHEITGPSIAADPTPRGPAHAAVSKLRWVSRRWKPDRHAEPRRARRRQEHDHVVPVQQLAPHLPARRRRAAGMG